ncbi:MAG: hypothetical protein GY820_39795 [Gammaproteobacteria bacterium]|nr:hypothetical protein [Gammaproteobacteria bacterium]
MNKVIVILCVALMAVSAFGQDISRRESRDDAVKFRAIWNAAADTVGAKNGATVTASEQSRFINKTTLSLNDVAIAVTDLTGTTNSCGGTKIYDFPAGQIYVLGFQVENFAFTTNATIGATAGGDYAFGTTVGAGPALTTTEIDLTDAAVSIDPIVTVTDAISAFDTVAESQWDGTATAKDIYVNLLIDGGDIAADTTNTVDATVTMYWLNLGDL